MDSNSEELLLGVLTSVDGVVSSRAEKEDGQKNNASAIKHILVIVWENEGMTKEETYEIRDYSSSAYSSSDSSQPLACSSPTSPCSSG